MRAADGSALVPTDFRDQADTTTAATLSARCRGRGCRRAGSSARACSRRRASRPTSEDPPPDQQRRPRRCDFISARPGRVRVPAREPHVTYNRQTGTSPLPPVPCRRLRRLAGPDRRPRSPTAPTPRPSTRRPASTSRPRPPAQRAPAPQGADEIVGAMFLPAGPSPPAAGRWRSSATASPTARTARSRSPSVAIRTAGLATVSINVVGHGGGALGTLDVGAEERRHRSRCPQAAAASTRTATATSTPRKARAPTALRNIISSRDALRQTTIDLMQLIRQIEAGIDVDGDGSVDLEPAAHLLLGPIVRRHLRHHPDGHRAAHQRRRAQRAGRLDHRDRAPSPAFRPLTALALQPRAC